MFYREYVCEYCGKTGKKEVRHRYQTKKKQRFCGRSCINKWKHESGILNSKGSNNPMSGKSIKECWTEKYGEEEAERRAKSHSKSVSRVTSGENNPMHGKTHSVESRQKMSRAHGGKTLEERWGEDRARKFKEALSKRMTGAGNHMFGKTSSGGRSIKGTYKGHFFRSLLEYSFMRHLEEQGHNLKDVDYETIRISVSDVMTYKPDFFVPATQTLYEVKPAYAVSREENVNKFAAARNYCREKGWTFAVVTENDFRKIPFAEAQADANVTFDERTLTYFRKTS